MKHELNERKNVKEKQMTEKAAIYIYVEEEREREKERLKEDKK